ncbi:response regulator transcription factor [Actinoplanes sp. NPDC051633]|uniref:response regulator transcription factor n=1 Tax=Actinoplanes sp. NPDC051633 TaxID=3155670 RepID=UPI0034428514
MIRVLIADDQQLIRSGLRALLDRDAGIEVVAEAADGLEAVRLAAAVRPDVILMDVRMPGVDGVEATARVEAPVIVLTTYDGDATVFAALRAGAAGFLLKDVRPDDLRQAVRDVAAGRSILAPAVTGRVMAAAAQGHTASPERLDGLTGREREVLAAVAAGHRNGEIADLLGISEATARTHVGRLLSKLGVRDRAQLVMIAYESGLVRPGP